MMSQCPLRFPRGLVSAFGMTVVLAGCGRDFSFERQSAEIESRPAETALASWERRAEGDAVPGQEETAEPHDDTGAVMLSELELNRELTIDDVVDPQYVAALDRQTGRLLWKRPRDSDHSYSSPLLVHHYDVPQVVSVGGRGLASYDPETGQELWWCRHDGHSVVPRPVYGNGLVYVCTGYTTPSLYAIDPSGTQDVTETHIRWKAEKGIPFNASPILVDSLLFLISDVGVLSCYDAIAGELLWQHRLRGRFSSSPILADGRLFITSDDGVTSIVQPGEKFQLVGRGELNETVQASPSVAGRSLLIRTENHLYRIEAPGDRRSTAEEVDWPQFRGPTGQGDAGQPGLPTSWNEETNVVWKAEIPGRGWSSPVACGDRIWLTTAIEEDDGAVQLQLLCLDRNSGEILNRTHLLRKLNPEPMHPRSSHATPTPVVSDDRVIVHFGAHVTAAVSTEGELLWRTRLPYHHHHGPAASLIVVGDRVIVSCDGYDGPYDEEGARARGEKEPDLDEPR